MQPSYHIRADKQVLGAPDKSQDQPPRSSSCGLRNIHRYTARCTAARQWVAPERFLRPRHRSHSSNVRWRLQRRCASRGGAPSADAAPSEGAGAPPSGEASFAAEEAAPEAVAAAVAALVAGQSPFVASRGQERPETGRLVYSPGQGTWLLH